MESTFGSFALSPFVLTGIKKQLREKKHGSLHDPGAHDRRAASGGFAVSGSQWEPVRDRWAS